MSEQPISVSADALHQVSQQAEVWEFTTSPAGSTWMSADAMAALIRAEWADFGDWP